MDILQCAVSDIVITPCNLFILSKLLEKKINFKEKKTYLIIIIMYIATLINYIYNNEFIRIFSITLVMTIISYVLFNEKIRKTALASVILQFTYMISEIFFGFGLLYIIKVDPNDFVSIYFGKFLTNLVICLIAFILIKINIIKKLFKFLLKITDKISTKIILILISILMITANIFAGIVYYDYNYTYIMLFNVTLTGICFLIIINSFYNKNKFIKTYDKYKMTLNSLQEYESILEKYKIANHENKNQLLTIKGMINDDNKKISSYIDSIIKTKCNDDNDVMKLVSKIPAGGLKGLIYSKILVMKKSNINYQLNISKEIKTSLFININDDLLLDICNIVGVFIDNAIQEVEKINERYINIDFYLENSNLIISISNNFSNIELEKIEKPGYSTKEKGHGYGLALAKQIIDNNNRISNTKKIYKNIFTQIINIKID